MTEGTTPGLAETVGLLLPHLDERQRRLVLGAAARVYGHGGIRLMAGVASAAESTVARGLREPERGGAGRVVAGSGPSAQAASGCGISTRSWSLTS